MRTVGIIAEYNPFHNGHKYQLDYARNVLKADCILVAMSGSFTQRGSIACFDKYVRANAALLNGADLVFELPSVFATSSAREFASAGVVLLNATGIMDSILFGTEGLNSEEFIKNAKNMIALEKDENFNTKLQKLLAQGQTYAEARSQAASEIFDLKEFSSPNNILGIEYTKYILENNLKIKIETIRRNGSAYNDQIMTGEFSSASSIRKAMENNEDFSDAVPENVRALYENAVSLNENDISEMLHYKLLSENDFSNYLDCNKDISDRINNIKGQFIDYSSFCQLLKTKNISLTRASRVLCHILLNIKQQDFNIAKENGYINSLRLLGFSKNGATYLQDIKNKCSVPLVTKADALLLPQDIYASDIVRIIQTDKAKKQFPNEFTRKFHLTNI